MTIKLIKFLGDSLKRLREFPENARQDAGYQLGKVQRGDQPDDFKPMPTIGTGVEEIRVQDESGIYRLVYTARLEGNTPGFSGKKPDIEQPGVVTFQRSFPQDPGKFCTPFCSVVSAPQSVHSSVPIRLAVV